MFSVFGPIFIAQIRLNELETTFQDKIAIEQHFVPVFENAHEKSETRWRDHAVPLRDRRFTFLGGDSSRFCP